MYYISPLEFRVPNILFDLLKHKWVSTCTLYINSLWKVLNASTAREPVSINSRCNAHTQTYTSIFYFIIQYLSSKYLDVKWFCLYQNMRIRTFAGPNESGGCKRKKTASSIESVKGICFAVVHLPNGKKKLHFFYTKLCTRTERIRFLLFIQFPLEGA